MAARMNLAAIGLAAGLAWQAAASKPVQVQPNIRIDQFGYRPGDKKIAVVVDPQIGFNAGDRFEPGSLYEVRRCGDDSVVYSGPLKEWNRGAVDFSAGDRGWWFDFTPVNREGEYVIFDREKNVGSHAFRISPDVYKDVLKAAMRMFYYQRLNDPKVKPYAEEPWTDAAAFMGPGQDGEARSLADKGTPTTARDLSGGWMDAGDYNKYVTFADSPIHMLLTSYEQNPRAFTDDFDIPESGNGVPDVLDEVKFELDWIKKMQQADGGVFIKMGNIDYNTVSPPSADKRPRYYGPECSSSSIAAAGMFAHAALVLSEFPGLAAYAADLESRAVRAWNWYQTRPRSESCDDGEIKAGDADCSLDRQDEMEVVSAVYLFALTKQEKYHKIVKMNFSRTAPFYDTYLFLYFSHQGDALLYYTTLKSADKNVKAAVLSQRQKQGKGLDVYQNKPKADLYMAYIPTTLYTWGSNNPRAALGSANYDFVTYNLEDRDKAKYVDRALGILHYFHGVNPMGIVYLSNMSKYGAEYSCDEIWHDWFRKGSIWGKNPAPGYVTGGPNFWYDGSRRDISIQPPQKCYMNWNASVPENSWEITEPAIYYQASYVKLLSKFLMRD